MPTVSDQQHAGLILDDGLAVDGYPKAGEVRAKELGDDGRQVSQVAEGAVSGGVESLDDSCVQTKPGHQKERPGPSTASHGIVSLEPPEVDADNARGSQGTHEILARPGHPELPGEEVLVAVGQVVQGWSRPLPFPGEDQFGGQQDGSVPTGRHDDVSLIEERGHVGVHGTGRYRGSAHSVSMPVENLGDAVGATPGSPASGPGIGQNEDVHVAEA